MSDPEVPQNEQKSDVDDVVDSANAGLAEAEAARASNGDDSEVGVSRGDADGDAVEFSAPAAGAADAVGADYAAARTNGAESTGAGPTGAGTAAADSKPIDPDLAAFEAAERDHPGTFGGSEHVDSSRDDFDSSRAGDGAAAGTAAAATAASSASAADDYRASTADEYRANSAADDYRSSATADESIADTAYAPPVAEPETRVMPSEPASEPYRSEPADTVIAAPIQQQQPIFVQAPEAPRERGNRGTAGAIGLLATVVFAILYLAIGLGWRALQGDVNGSEIVEDILATVTTWGFWVPVVVFFIGFWLLGAIINRGRWGLWVVFGLLVGVVAYGGYILGQLFEAPFWQVTASEVSALVGEQLFAPMAIAAFVLGRELTIWFGAWVARSGARKTELNDEAQREYERTLEAGPTLSR